MRWIKVRGPLTAVHCLQNRDHGESLNRWVLWGPVNGDSATPGLFFLIVALPHAPAPGAECATPMRRTFPVVFAAWRRWIALIFCVAPIDRAGVPAPRRPPTRQSTPFLQSAGRPQGPVWALISQIRGEDLVPAFRRPAPQASTILATLGTLVAVCDGRLQPISQVALGGCVWREPVQGMARQLPKIPPPT